MIQQEQTGCAMIQQEQAGCAMIQQEQAGCAMIQQEQTGCAMIQQEQTGCAIGRIRKHLNQNKTTSRGWTRHGSVAMLVGAPQANAARHGGNASWQC